MRLVDWLNGQETRHSKLVYEADTFDSEWTARCLRQADLVLFVVRSREDCTEAGSRVAHLSRVGDVSGKPRILVILQESGSAPPKRTRDRPSASRGASFPHPHGRPEGFRPTGPFPE